MNENKETKKALLIRLDPEQQTLLSQLSGVTQRSMANYMRYAFTAFLKSPAGLRDLELLKVGKNGESNEQ